MLKVVHLTSVHPRYDTRIYHKECMSLVKGGFNVTLIVADSKGNEIKNGMTIIDVGKEQNRIKRFLRTTYRVYKEAVNLDADVYHFHDPELLFCGYLLKKKKKKVIYDVHEDVPLQLMTKPYLFKWQKRIISYIINKIEKTFSARFDYIFTATDFIRDIFLRYNKLCTSIKNYPILGQLSNNSDWTIKENAILYVGAIHKERGIYEVIESLNYIEPAPIFYIAGIFSPYDNEDSLKVFQHFPNVRFLGFIDKIKYKNLCEISKVGIITDHPIKNYVDAYATKMFEYMEAGLPVLCSNFPNWVKIIDKYQCGIAVDPFDIQGVASALKILLNDNEKARTMGQNGKNAVRDVFNWNQEEEKMLRIYHQFK